MGLPRTLWRHWPDLSSLGHLNNFLPRSESLPTAEHHGQRARTLRDRGVRNEGFTVSPMPCGALACEEWNESKSSRTW